MGFETIEVKKSVKKHTLGMLAINGLYVPYDMVLKAKIGEDYCFAIDKEERKVAIMPGTMYSQYPFTTSLPDGSKRILFYGSKFNIITIMNEFPQLDLQLTRYYYELHVDDGIIWFEPENPVMDSTNEKTVRAFKL